MNRSSRVFTRVLGIALIGFALIIAFGITISSMKEQDHSGLRYLFIPVAFLVAGVIVTLSVRAK